MANGYTFIGTLPMIGTKSGTTRTVVQTTSAFADSISRITPIGGASAVEFSILYRPLTNNAILVRVETGPDATNMYQLVNDSISGGTSTLSLRTFSHTPATSAVTFSLPIDVSTKYIRVAVRESVTDVAASSAYVEMTILGDK